VASHVVHRDDDGTFRLMSYDVIDSVEDARESISPREVDEAGDQESPSVLENVRASARR
jgi:hypothetical protein